MAKRNSNKVNTNDVILGLFVNFLAQHEDTIMADFHKCYKRNSELAKVAQELDFAGCKEESDKIYALYEKQNEELRSRVFAFGREFMKANEAFLYIVTDISEGQLQYFFEKNIWTHINY